MFCKFALLGMLLLATSVHPSQPGAPLNHHGDNLQSSNAADGDGTMWTQAFAGFVLMGEFFESMTATITVPTLTGSDSAVLISTGFDVQCRTGSLVVNMEGNIGSNKVQWSAWSQWRPHPRVDFNITMKANDALTITIIVTSPTTGVVFLENKTNHQTDLQKFNSTDSNSLCMRDVGWAIQANVDKRGSFIALADFGTTNFTDAMATAVGLHETYRPFGPSKYTLYGILQNAQRIASASGNGTTLTVKHA